MNTWSRCRHCGAINDHDAHACYLCGTSPLMQSCPNCGADFINPMDTRCPSCGEIYQISERTSTPGGIADRENEPEKCGDHHRERYLDF